MGEKLATTDMIIGGMGTGGPTATEAMGTPPLNAPRDSVAMISSRKGMTAGVAWVDDASGQVMVNTINGLGMATGAPVAA